MDFVTWSSKVNPISEESENTQPKIKGDDEVLVLISNRNAGFA